MVDEGLAETFNRAEAMERAVPLHEQHDVLVTPAADRLDEPAALRELRNKRRRNMWARCRDEDRVVGRVLRQTFAAVADDHVNVGRAVTREVRPSGFGEVVPALDTPDLGGETAE
jgi:hypothetical protein